MNDDCSFGQVCRYEFKVCFGKLLWLSVSTKYRACYLKLVDNNVITIPDLLLHLFRMKTVDLITWYLQQAAWCHTFNQIEQNYGSITWLLEEKTNE